MSVDESNAMCNRAQQFADGQRYPEAVQAFQAAIQLSPQNARAYTQFVKMLHTIEHYAEALKVVAAVPKQLYKKDVELQLYHADCLSNLGDLEKAIKIYRALVKAGQNDPVIHNNLGSAYDRLQRYQQALPCYLAAHENGNRSESVFINIATIYGKLEQIDKSIKWFEKGLATHPHSHELHARYGVSLMLHKDGEEFVKGVEHYQYRRLAPDFLADEQNLEGIKPKLQRDDRQKTVFVYAEQGVGDHIVYSKLLTYLSEQHELIYFATDIRITNLFHGIWPNVKPIARKTEQANEILQQCDCYIDLPDLCAFFSDKLFLPSEPSLQVAEGLGASFEEKYAKAFPGDVRVGISWSSSRQLIGGYKTIDIMLWKDILKLEGAQFFNLQYGEVTSALDKVKQKFQVDVYDDPEVDCFHELEKLAAQISVMDLVITSSNVTAHIAAAMGKKVWVILPKSDGVIWYWREGSNGELWYPTSQLFRQKSPGDWKTPLKEVANQLRDFLASKAEA